MKLYRQWKAIFKYICCTHSGNRIIVRTLTAAKPKCKQPSSLPILIQLLYAILLFCCILSLSLFLLYPSIFELEFNWQYMSLRPSEWNIQFWIICWTLLNYPDYLSVDSFVAPSVSHSFTIPCGSVPFYLECKKDYIRNSNTNWYGTRHKTTAMQLQVIIM